MASALTQRVLDDIGQAIVDGAIPPGTVLLLDDLTERTSASRTTVRDAVKVLEAQGLVQPRRHVGIEVLARDHWDHLSENVVRWRLNGPDRVAALHEISQLRNSIEPAAAALAAAHATAAQREAIDKAAVGMHHTGAAGDLEAYLAHDVVFHRGLLDASGNPMLASLGYLVERVLEARTHHHLMPSRPNEVAVRLHRRVAEAIATGAAEEARRAMAEIVTEADTAVTRMARRGRPKGTGSGWG